MNPLGWRAPRVCMSLLIAALLVTATACENVVHPPVVQTAALAPAPPPPPPTTGPATLTKPVRTTTTTTPPATTATTAPPATTASTSPAVGTPLPAPTNLGSSKITDYIKLGGDKVVVVPDGVYHGGTVLAPHGATSGPYGGWLVLVAQHRGQVVVDMSNDYDIYNNNERSL